MEHRVTIPLNSPSAHSVCMVELAIASVWVIFILLAHGQEKREASTGGGRPARRPSIS